METKDFSKDFFQNAWGPDGYYERFNYGVGFDKVVQTCLVPFFNLDHVALEIGSGGGTFTEKMVNLFAHVTAVDVIKMPVKFDKWSREKFKYREQGEQSFFICDPFDVYDFAFSYNCFCHLSNEALKEYVASVHSVLKPGGNFVFMLANYNKNPQGYTGELGELLPFGHFYQDDRTIDIIVGEGWEIVSRNMIPEHRDIIVHLKKKHA